MKNSKQVKSLHDVLPPTGKEVLVRHNGTERMAYRDADGKWRDLHDGDVLLGEVKIVKLH